MTKTTKQAAHAALVAERNALAASLTTTEDSDAIVADIVRCNARIAALGDFFFVFFVAPGEGTFPETDEGWFFARHFAAEGEDSDATGPFATQAEAEAALQTELLSDD